MKILKNTENLDFWIFRRVLRPRRHPIGFPEHVVSILYEYEPERSHMDLFRISFHDFLPNLAFSNLHNLYICYTEIVNLLRITKCLCGTITTLKILIIPHQHQACHGLPWGPLGPVGPPIRRGGGA